MLGQALWSHAVASVAVKMGLPMSSAGGRTLPGLTEASASRETAPRAEEEKAKESLSGSDSTTCIPESWSPGCHSKAWPSLPFSSAHDACHSTGSISPGVFPRSDPPQKLRRP